MPHAFATRTVAAALSPARATGLIAAVLMTITLPAQAAGGSGGVYAAIGLPGVIVGYAHPVSDLFTVRADYATLGSRSKNGNQEGIDYSGTLKIGRFGVFGDYFFTGGFRATLGLTFNQIKADLHFQGNGGAVTFGNATATADASDTFDATVKFPSTTPYIGIGYGHQAQEKGGVSFVVDAGVSIGRAKLEYTASPSLVAKVGQANIDAEAQELEDGVGKVRVIPQVSIGLSYSF